MERPPINTPFQTKDGIITPAWAAWINKLWLVAGCMDEDHGPTVNRPTKGLYVGRRYIDEDLGKPIWVESVNPTVWIDSTGTSV